MDIASLNVNHWNYISFSIRSIKNQNSINDNTLYY